MLEAAIKNQSQLQDLYKSVIDKKEYQYFVCNDYIKYTLEIEDSSWSRLQYVSKSNNTILGYMSANIDRNSYSVSSLLILKFDLTKISPIFIKDVEKFVQSLFLVYGFDKINFSVVIGNPAERLYDYFIKKYNGRVVGIFKRDVRLQDGSIHNRKVYEILKEEFFQMYYKNFDLMKTSVI